MDAAERQRYSRQILFPGIGERGQEALLRSHAVVVGCGALGSFHAAALARAGVGRLTIIDRDYVEPSNLHRQWLFEESDAAESLPKAAAAERRIARINSGVQRARRGGRPDGRQRRRSCWAAPDAHSGRHRQFRNALPDQRFRREPRRFRGSTERRWAVTA